MEQARVRSVNNRWVKCNKRSGAAMLKMRFYASNKKHLGAFIPKTRLWLGLIG